MGGEDAQGAVSDEKQRGERRKEFDPSNAATEAANQGGSLRLRPPPKTKPDPFLLRHAVVIANADPHGGQALRRIQRLFLGWSDYDDLSGYENFGWWDLQGDPENADQEEADEIDLDPDSDEADDFAECTSPYE